MKIGKIEIKMKTFNFILPSCVEPGLERTKDNITKR